MFTVVQWFMDASMTMCGQQPCGQPAVPQVTANSQTNPRTTAPKSK